MHVRASRRRSRAIAADDVRTRRTRCRHSEVAPGSTKLVARIVDIYPDSEHVRNKGLQSASDSEIWSFAKKDGYVIVTEDDDFHVRSVLEGPPPKILWIRSGNCSADLVETLLRKNITEIKKFQQESVSGFLALF